MDLSEYNIYTIHNPKVNIILAKLELAPMRVNNSYAFIGYSTNIH
jgi:hypothetical protein